MLKLLLCFAAALVAVQCSGDFVVLHTPDSVAFSGNEEVEQSLLKEVFAACLGFTVKLKGMWSGMSIIDPFELPEAVALIAVEGVQSLDIRKGVRFPLNVNEVEETTWQACRERLEARDNDNTLVRIYLGDGVDALGQSALGELKPLSIDETSLKALSLNKEEDKKFLEEMQLLQAIAEKAPSVIKADSKPDIYWFVVSGLRPVFDAHGRNSTAAREALLLLNNALSAISNAFVKAYDGKVIVAAFSNDANQVRHTRSAILERQLRDVNDGQGDNEDENRNVGAEEDTITNTDSTSESDSDISTSTAYYDATEKSDQELNTEHNIISKTKKLGQGDLNLAKDYRDDYPIIFNIMLWFGIAFVFSLLAICIAIASMDPGRDSIIYRMTSNRMKKDN